MHVTHLIIIRHPHNLMRYDLPNTENKIMTALPYELVELGGPGLGDHALGGGAYHGGGSVTDCHDVVAPIMDAENVGRAHL